MNNPIGCHVSIAGGIFNAPENASSLKCETFQIFTRSPHGGSVTEISEEVVTKFKVAMKQGGFTRFVVHAPYIINFGSSNKRTFHGSISIVRKELERSSLLGAEYLMFHPGSIKDNDGVGFNQAIEGINEVLKDYDGTTKLLIEISAGAGQVIGDTFEEIALMINKLKKNKGFGGVCFDTQHAFASGYDLRKYDNVKSSFEKFDKVIGIKWLKMLHANDSKVDLGSHKDRHEHIGDGKIGEQGFKAILRFLEEKKLDLPLILETQHDKVDLDIKKLKRLREQVRK